MAKELLILLKEETESPFKSASPEDLEKREAEAEQAFLADYRAQRKREREEAEETERRRQERLRYEASPEYQAELKKRAEEQKKREEEAEQRRLEREKYEQSPEYKAEQEKLKEFQKRQAQSVQRARATGTYLRQYVKPSTGNNKCTFCGDRIPKGTEFLSTWKSAYRGGNNLNICPKCVKHATKWLKIGKE